MKISLAFSTCPNDTFIFDALVNRRVNNPWFSFSTFLADIQELNGLAAKGEVDLVKVSFALLPSISVNYQMLTAGSALGNGVGPLVISKRKIYPDELSDAKIAIPGEHTTANLLFSLAYPDAKQKKVLLFSEIEEAILENVVDAGVIIHENRFTYQQKGLTKIFDLGEFWEKETGLPIPLGGIAVRRSLPDEVKLRLNKLVRSSVEYAFANPSESYPFVRANAQSMDIEVMRQHIDLYVNHFSVDVGEKGRDAVKTLLGQAEKVNFVKTKVLCNPIFVTG